MHCLQQCIGEVLDNGWRHHIPRLMVLGNFALIAGVEPSAVNDWFLAMYVDAVDWVTAPNVVGMSQHADLGVVGTKPYAGSADYVNRMSNCCQTCRYDPKEAHGRGRMSTEYLLLGLHDSAPTPFRDEPSNAIGSQER